jgi:mono/diheme cytochrome c family protein
MPLANLHETAAFLGRFHPLWVHLPIGIFILLAALEFCGLLSRIGWVVWLPDISKRQRTLILVLGAAAAVFTACLGWLLARSGDYDSTLVDTHRWLGVAAAGGAVLLLLVHRVWWLYGPLFVASLVLLILAGHAGGKITHGNDYLTVNMPPRLKHLLGIPIPAPKRVQPDAAHAVVFDDVMQPILEQRCVSCHGPSKSNGGLRVDTWDFLAKGGKHGPVLASELLRRIDLPVDEKEHMPPKGKPQLGDDDLTLLEWWLGSGAPRKVYAASLSAPADVADINNARFGGKAPEPPPYRVATLVRATKLAPVLGILIRPLSPDGPWIDVNARVAGKAFGNEQLSQLVQIAPAVTWLDLGGTSVNDAGLAQVAAMHWLERLHLDGTAVTDAGLAYLSNLKHLRYLNLERTAVTDKGLPALVTMTNLRALYVWQTEVTPGAVKILGDTLVDKRKNARWAADRDELERLIEADRFIGDTGESLHLDVKPPESPSTGTAGTTP